MAEQAQTTINERTGEVRYDLGHGYGAYERHAGYIVYSPHGFLLGVRKTLDGARSLAQRRADRAR